ncbi:MAG: UDP-3-O-(3-hydroxymyristoyl)glucosamine N-acyltransferase [PVC group bacterium]
MKKTLKEIAGMIGGELAGDPSITVGKIAGLEGAEPGSLVWIEKKRYLKDAEKTAAAAVICGREIESSLKPLIRVDNPRLAFARLAQVFFPPRRFAPGISPDATVSPEAGIGSGVSIQPRAVIEAGVKIGDRTVIGAGTFIGLNSKVGSDTRLYPNVTVNEDVEIGDRCIIHSGAVLGGDGFGYVQDETGLQVKIPQVGKVIIEDNVEIGCNVCVDRATFGETIIRKGTKIDNLVQIAHNDDIGENCAISGLSALAGSVKTGKNVIMGGQCGIADHVEIGDNVILGARAGLAPHKKVKPNQILWGAPARPINEAKLLYVMESRKLKEIMQERESWKKQDDAADENGK